MCRSISPTGTCTGPTKASGDPGCPLFNRQTEGEPADNCWAIWNEPCVGPSSVATYDSAQSLFVTTCFTCEGTAAR